MEHTHCHDLLESLSEYMDGSASEKLCEEIERHMMGCERCRIVVDTLRKTVYLVKEAEEPVDMPEEVRQRLIHSLDLDEFIK